MSEIINEMLVHSGKQVVSFAPKLFVSMIIFLAFYAVAWVLRRIAVNLGREAGDDRAKIYGLVGSVLRIVVILIGLITALGTLGVDVTAMVAGLGLTGFALGFALKDALSNLLAGILILFYRPFHCGDRIRVSGCEGVVMDIDLRYTKLDGGDEEFLIPNSKCFTNWIAVSKDSTERLSSD